MAMSKKSGIMKIWEECFSADSLRRLHMFFDAACVDEEALTAEDPATGTIVSSLLLLPYSMTFGNSTLGVAYIYGAGTLRRHRAKGHMSRLMGTALREAAARGDTFAAVIPPSDVLRNYYKRFGFSTVFFLRPVRFASVHRFPVEGSYIDMAWNSPKLFDTFERLMVERSCCVQHTRSQFLAMMEDMHMCGHFFAAVADMPTGEPAAMAWAKPEVAGEGLIVTELLSVSPDATNAVLSALQLQYPGHSLTLMTRPDNNIIGGNLTPGGMARVVNAGSALGIVASDNPAIRLTIKVTDKLLPENNGIYVLNGGRLTVCDSLPKGSEVNLDVSAEVLTALLFSSEPIGSIMGLPACRPHMSLMFD